MQKVKRNNTRSLYFTNSVAVKIERIYNYPLTIIEAPMGYGKSTAVREYLKNSGLNTLWLTAQDSSAVVFWKVFCHQLGKLDYDISQNLKELGFPDDSISRQEALNLIKNIELRNNTFLVIDDYHVIRDLEMNTFIEFLVINEIPNLHIVLTARHTRFQNAEELKLKGYMLHITKDAFELSADDIKHYYHLCGIILKDSEAEKLYDLTEGWISALYLLMLNYIEYGSFETTKNINKLIENAVYIHFSEEIKEFVQSLCLLDSFTIEEAAFVSGNENAERLLSEIIEINAFVKYDEITKTYHIHNIFTKYLKDLFDSRKISYKKQLHIRLAEFHMKGGNYLEAMKYYYMAEDYENLLSAVEADRGHSIHNEQHDDFIFYFENCPKSILHEHPIAVLVYAICLFSFNETERFQKVCMEFPGAVMDNVQLDTEYRKEVMGEFELLLSFTEYNDIQKMYEHLKKARELLQQPAKFMDTGSSWTFGSPSVLYMFYRESGTLQKELQSLKEAMPVYYQLTNCHGAGGELVMEAEWYFNRGNFESAEIIAHKALYAANRYGQGDIVICVMFLQARIAIVKGEYSNAYTILQKMHEEMSRRRWYNMLHTIELCEAFIYAGLKQGNKVPLWIRNGEFETSRLYFPARSFLNITFGRVLLINGEYLKLLGAAEHFVAEASVFPNLLGQIYTCIFIAAANERIYRRSDAKDALKQALCSAAADKVYMPFVENCDFIKPLLEELYIEGYCKEDIRKILDLYKIYQLAEEQILREHFTEDRPMLTEREKEIARLAAEGMTNKEIGERLFISANTVKMALKSIFSKLSINNRALLKEHL